MRVYLSNFNYQGNGYIMLQKHEDLLKRITDLQYAVRFKKPLAPFNDLQEKYPHLYRMILVDDDPTALEKVRYMLMISERIDNDELSSHQADVLVGQRFANEYINPLIEKKEQKS